MDQKSTLAMEGKMIKRPIITINYIPQDSIQKWQISDKKDFPSLWNPLHKTSNKFGDLHLYGVEVTTTQSKEISEIGFIVDIADMDTKTIYWPSLNTAKTGIVVLKDINFNKPTFHEDQNQQLFYDPNSKVIEWKLNTEFSNEFICIASNLIIGAIDNTLQSLLIKLS